MKSFKEYYNEAHIDNRREELEQKIVDCKDAEQVAKYQQQLKDLLDSENKEYK